tara:strand:- start:2942 stop:3172 length:231 start_codon:yes stop_codon:yes gene_type:complete
MESRKLMEMVLKEGLIIKVVLSALKVQRSLFTSNQISFEEWTSETREIVNAASVLGVSREVIEALLKATDPRSTII